MIKANKAKVQKKAAKKTVKKDLEKSLTEGFLAVVKKLGHDAGHVAADISKASKAFAKTLTKAIVTPKDVDKSKPEVKIAKEATPRAVVKAHKALKKATKSTSPVIQSVKVSPILSEESVASAMKQKGLQAVSRSNPSTISKIKDTTKPLAATKISSAAPVHKSANANKTIKRSVSETPETVPKKIITKSKPVAEKSVVKEDSSVLPAKDQ